MINKICIRIGLCRVCKCVTTDRIRFTGLSTYSTFLCDPCFESAMADFRDKQRQFQFLIDNGVDRKRANDIMIRRIERIERLERGT